MLIVILAVPWYWPSKTYEPIVLGWPLWALIITIINIVYAIFITTVALKIWR